MRSRKNKNEAIKHIIRVIRDICNRYRDKVTQSTDLADKAVKELALPTGNIYAVALMREQLRQLTRMEMRRRHNDPDELETLIEGETGEDGQGDSTEPSKITIPCSAIRKARGLRAVIVSPGCAVLRFTLRALHQLASPFVGGFAGGFPFVGVLVMVTGFTPCRESADSGMTSMN